MLKLTFSEYQDRRKYCLKNRIHICAAIILTIVTFYNFLWKLYKVYKVGCYHSFRDGETCLTIPGLANEQAYSYLAGF